MAARVRGLEIDRSWVRAGERVCVAVSGGADSVALLVGMWEQRVELGLGVSAAHVHHGLRGVEADADEAFVRELCAGMGVALSVFRVDTAERQREEREGMEEAARELRYAALRGLMERGEADVVATAHTLDDQAETVMMKLLRGAWTEGLGGISPVVGAQESRAFALRRMTRVWGRDGWCGRCWGCGGRRWRRFCGSGAWGGGKMRAMRMSR